MKSLCSPRRLRHQPRYARGLSRQARQVQSQRFKGTSLIANAEMGPVEVWEFCQVDEGAKGLLQAAMKQMHLSARGFHRVLKLSRTIADLAGVESVGIAHLAEAFAVQTFGEPLRRK